jgi:hypothetical protein
LKHSGAEERTLANTRFWPSSDFNLSGHQAEIITGTPVIKREPDESEVVKLRDGSLSSNDSSQASLIAFWKPACAGIHRHYPNNRARLDLPPGVIDGEQPRQCSGTRFIGHREIPWKARKPTYANVR